jgi:hypothetical protein
MQLCYSVIDPDCQKALGATNCVKQAMDRDYWENHAPPPTPVTDTLAFKLGMGLGAAALVLAGLGAILFCKARRKRAEDAKMALPVCHVPAKGDGALGPSKGGLDHGSDPTRKASTNSYNLGAGMYAAPAVQSSSEDSLGSGGMHAIEDIALFNALPSILSSSLSREQAARVQLGEHWTVMLKLAERGGVVVLACICSECVGARCSLIMWFW